MRKLVLLPLAALSLAACGDVSNPVTAPDSALGNNGVSNPGTGVTSTFTVTTPGSTVITYLATPKNGKGRCEAGGVWYNQAGNNGGANHEQCTDVTTIPGATVTVTFSETANLVNAKSGNINLNFAAVCIPALNAETQEEECTFPSRSVQYHRNSNWTSGTGTIYGTGDDGSTWSIDLGQIGHSSNAQMLGKSIQPLVAQLVGSGSVAILSGASSYGAAALTW